MTPAVNVPVSALPGRRISRPEREMRQRCTRALEERAYLIHKQWWRPFRNRQRRAEVRLLMHVSWGDPE